MKHKESKIEISINLDENKIPEKYFGQPMMLILKNNKQKQLLFLFGMIKRKKV